MTPHPYEDPAGRRIIFWRHGRTEWNRKGLFQGQEDIDLDATGQDQAARAAEVLLTRQPTRIVSSDLRRARDTALALASLTGLEVRHDARLRETDAGRWQGLSFAQIDERFPEDNAAWRGGDPEVRAGGAESRLDVGRRMLAAVTDAVAGSSEGETLVVVSHGGSIRAALAALMGLPPERWGALAGLSNCHWSEVHEVVGRKDALFSWQLTEHNVGLGSLPSEPLEG
ncbi:phosphoglycerate mutase [Arthrobacter sp. RIT-PI-e]|uniref:histidine phosphatase family protein n=1 Tax=Arthrobacter sp. RIT-PI-e TaxID=1681197 RepID=UPI000676552E|nr:histidine phosphatase family protein [Arthrobacter sp. RIT-PI-e]KNC20521.1 phosphoglycerate mutase [Arthrobacter sp. RIT-PI-e]